MGGPEEPSSSMALHPARGMGCRLLLCGTSESEESLMRVAFRFLFPFPRSVSLCRSEVSSAVLSFLRAFSKDSAKFRS